MILNKQAFEKLMRVKFTFHLHTKCSVTNILNIFLIIYSTLKLPRSNLLIAATDLFFYFYRIPYQQAKIKRKRTQLALILFIFLNSCGSSASQNCRYFLFSIFLYLKKNIIQFQFQLIKLVLLFLFSNFTALSRKTSVGNMALMWQKHFTHTVEVNA